MAGFGYWVYTLVRPAQAQPGFGRPRAEATLSDGWTRYRFDDLGWTVELPGKPWPTPWDGTYDEKSRITGWSYYRVTGRASHIEFYAFWHRYESPYTAEQFADYENARVAKEGGYDGVKSKTIHRTVGSKPAVEVVSTYRSEGREVSSHDLYFIEGKVLRSVRSTASQSSSKLADQEWERMVGSIHFTQ